MLQVLVTNSIRRLLTIGNGTVVCLQVADILFILCNLLFTKKTTLNLFRPLATYVEIYWKRQYQQPLKNNSFSRGTFPHSLALVQVCPTVCFTMVIDESRNNFTYFSFMFFVNSRNCICILFTISSLLKSSAANFCCMPTLFSDS